MTEQKRRGRPPKAQTAESSVAKPRRGSLRITPPVPKVKEVGRATRAKKKVSAPLPNKRIQPTAPLKRQLIFEPVASWEDYVVGDRVRIKGEYKSQFVIKEFRKNLMTGKIEVSVYGGKYKEGMWRTFEASKLERKIEGKELW